MLAFQREVEERARAEVAAQVKRVREFEVGHARLEEAARCRREFDAARAELEASVSERMARVRAREEEAMARVRAAELSVERAAFEHRQRVMQDTEALAARGEEAKRDVEAAAAVRRGTEALLREREAALAAREAAVQQREATVQAEAASLRREIERETGGLLHAAREGWEKLEAARGSFAVRGFASSPPPHSCSLSVIFFQKKSHERSVSVPLNSCASRPLRHAMANPRRRSAEPWRPTSPTSPPPAPAPPRPSAPATWPSRARRRRSPPPRAPPSRSAAPRRSCWRPTGCSRASGWTWQSSLPRARRRRWRRRGPGRRLGLRLPGLSAGAPCA